MDANTLQGRIESKLDGFLSQNKRETEIKAMVAHGWFVVTKDGTSAVKLDGQMAELVQVMPGFIGCQSWGHADAVKLLNAVNGGAWGELVVMNRRQLLCTAIENARGLLDAVKEAGIGDMAVIS